MEVLFHFIFELVKVSILGSLYAGFTLLLFLLIGKRKPGSWFAKVSKKKLRFWFLSRLFISIGLFAYMFTYWGDHGLGDGPKIPIGNGIVVDNTNWTEYGYIKDLKSSDNIDIEMTQFKVIDDILIGNLDSWFYDFENSFFMYDMDAEKLIEFKTKNEFDEYLVQNELGTSSDLLTFSENYSNHWSGWRFWLLP